jgi:GntR family transcriptional regulator
MEENGRPGRLLKTHRQPLYTQAIAALHAFIEEGRYHAGDLLPSEDAMARQLGVSRSTLREALGNLESHGYVTRKQGVGTFVSATAQPWFMGGLERLESYHSLAARAGLEVRVVERQVSEDAADAGLAALLGLAPGARVLRVQVVEAVNGQRSAYIHTFVRADLARLEDLAAFDGSVIDYLSGLAGPALSHTRSEIMALPADEDLAARFEAPPGKPMLHLREVFYDAGGAALAVSFNYFLTDQFRFHVTRRVPQGGRAARPEGGA